MATILTTTIAETRQALADARAQGKTIGFVPTMGALHEGHASLIRAARAENDLVVVSVFVNPIQFGPREDLARYPRPFEQDVARCTREGVDLIFHPAPEVMYSPTFRTHVEVSDLGDMLCGKSRPGHFRGVATVVLKLLSIIQPTRAYFGQKDAQQARILLQMVRDLDVPVEMKVCPIFRERDGLAMSSRNIYLGAEERKNAAVLFRSLSAMRDWIEGGDQDVEGVIAFGRTMIEETAGARLDYVAIVNWETLQPVSRFEGKLLIAVAAFFGSTRLIDNVQVEIK